MLRVFSTADAVRAVCDGTQELLLQLPGDHTGDHESQIVRNQVWQQSKRRGSSGVSVTVARRGSDCTVFLVRRCPPLRRLPSSVQAEIFLAVAVTGLSRRQVAEKFGLPRTTVTDIVRRMKGLKAGKVVCRRNLGLVTVRSRR